VTQAFRWANGFCPGGTARLLARFSFYFAGRIGINCSWSSSLMAGPELEDSEKVILLMNQVLRHFVSTGIVGLFLASTAYAGVDSSPADAKQTHGTLSISSLQPVQILSQPAGARILINGDYVGTTPLFVDFAVDKYGRAVRNIEIRAVAPEPLETAEVRRFPAAGTDGDARIPRLVDFDLNVQSVFVIR
jgi:hypothetical protein